MSTDKKRINVSVSEPMEKAIKNLAKRDSMPEATKAAELLRLAIEIEEDAGWEKIASDRLRSDKRRVSHSNAWR